MKKAGQIRWLIFVAGLLVFWSEARAEDVFARFRLIDSEQRPFAVHLGGYIHKTPWYLPKARFPKAKDQWFMSGQFSPWINLTEWADKRMHGSMSRAGGIAELPCVTLRIEMTDMPENPEIEIELADRADVKAVRKRWREKAPGGVSGFLISPDLKKDAKDLESTTEMADRRLNWAKKATGGKRITPDLENHIIQTSLWSAQRPDLNLKEAETLWLLGFNVLGNQHAPIGDHFAFARPGHTHQVAFGPGATREQVDSLMKKHAEKSKGKMTPGTLFGLSDEIVARPRMGTNAQALAHFHQWLKEEQIKPSDLGVTRIEDVVPIEAPDVWKQRMKENEAAARRVFYYTSRFRQLAATDRLRWNTEALHQHFGNEFRSSSLVADHPYFAGTGMGMGIQPDTAWGSHALSLDWFDLVRRKAVDVIGIEDWMGLQYMYGPNYTWEGFQLMGFQASIMRSGGNAGVPIISWITPSDEINLRLKSASALCQGAKHFFYWTYGPTNTSTENYWSDLQGAYDGITHITRQLEQCGDIIAKGQQPGTSVALLYSLSSDLFQPFDYLHMLERRCLYLSLVHNQYTVDLLTEEDVVAGKLAGYDVLYTADPCISTGATRGIRKWVKEGGRIFATCGAGSMNEFGEQVGGLADVFGIEGKYEVQLQPGNYRVRGKLNDVAHLDQLAGFGVIGMRSQIKIQSGEVVETFKDGSPAVIENQYGKGKARYVATTPGVSYAKDAKFVAKELKEKWPLKQRDFINSLANEVKAKRAVRLSEDVVEAGLYIKGNSAAALVLANFVYDPIESLEVEVDLPFVPTKVRSCETGKLSFEVVGGKVVKTKVDLGINDILLLEQ